MGRPARSPRRRARREIAGGTHDRPIWPRGSGLRPAVTSPVRSRRKTRGSFNGDSRRLRLRGDDDVLAHARVAAGFLTKSRPPREGGAPWSLRSTPTPAAVATALRGAGSCPSSVGAPRPRALLGSTPGCPGPQASAGLALPRRLLVAIIEARVRARARTACLPRAPRQGYRGRGGRPDAAVRRFLRTQALQNRPRNRRDARGRRQNGTPYAVMGCQNGPVSRRDREGLPRRVRNRDRGGIARRLSPLRRRRVPRLKPQRARRCRGPPAIADFRTARSRISRG